MTIVILKRNLPSKDRTRVSRLIATSVTRRFGPAIEISGDISSIKDLVETIVTDCNDGTQQVLQSQQQPLHDEQQVLQTERDALKAAFNELYNFFKKIIDEPSRMDEELNKLNVEIIDAGVKCNE